MNSRPLLHANTLHNLIGQLHPNYSNTLCHFAHTSWRDEEAAGTAKRSFPGARRYLRMLITQVGGRSSSDQPTAEVVDYRWTTDEASGRGHLQECALSDQLNNLLTADMLLTSQGWYLARQIHQSIPAVTEQTNPTLDPFDPDARETLYRQP